MSIVNTHMQAAKSGDQRISTGMQSTAHIKTDHDKNS